MDLKLPQIFLTRHGETPWNLTGQHTGRMDLPLTKRGEDSAVLLGKRLKNWTFSKVFASPLQRAVRTCELAGFKQDAELDPNLVEWDYGQYEGRRFAEIRADRPDWNLFRDGCPGGESPAQVGARTDAVIQRISSLEGNVLLFSSGHFLRVLAARWLGLTPEGARFFYLDTTSISILGFEHERSQPIIRLWNDTGHLL